MNYKEDKRFMDAGLAESEQYEPDEEVRQEFEDAQRLASGDEQLVQELRLYHSTSAELSSASLDVASIVDDAGEEAVGGANPTPDQDVVEELGAAVGILYEDNEPLHTAEKLEMRDRHRWELDPASSEDYPWRVNHEGE